MKTVYNFICFSLILLVFIPFENQAQSIKRQCISSYGVNFKSNNITFKQTVGQPYNTIALNEHNTSILPGFQQPNTFETKIAASDLLKTLKLNIYPNPAAYSVTIISEQIIENSTIRITDLTGKVIMCENSVNLFDYTISCETWVDGIYIININDENKKSFSFKLTINK